MPTFDSEDAIAERWREERAALERREEDLRAAVGRARDGLRALEDIVSCHRDVFDTSDAWAGGHGVFRAIRSCGEHLDDCVGELARVRAEEDDCDGEYARLLQLARADARGNRQT